MVSLMIAQTVFRWVKVSAFIAMKMDACVKMVEFPVKWQFHHFRPEHQEPVLPAEKKTAAQILY